MTKKRQHLIHSTVNSLLSSIKPVLITILEDIWLGKKLIKMRVFIIMSILIWRRQLSIEIRVYLMLTEIIRMYKSVEMLMPLFYTARNKDCL